MAKQSKKIYSELISRIALVLLINQGLLLLLSTVLATLEGLCKATYRTPLAFDFVFRACECIVYFVSFVVPMNIFKKMNKNSEHEIYEPLETSKASTAQGIYMLGIGLGATFVATYLNYLFVNAFSNYAEFSQEYLWSVQLEQPYQIIIYFIYCAIVAPVAEELLFRGAICKSLEIYGKKTAILLSAILFALMHTNVEQLLYSFVAGIFLAWVFVETKSIIYPIILHLINNSLSVVGDVIYLKCTPEAYEIYSDVSSAAVLVLMALGIVGYVASLKKGRSAISVNAMKPDENGEEVLPLTKNEKIAGFFTTRMIIFVLYSLITMIYYVYLSTQLI